MRFILASGNAKKLVEMKEILGAMSLEVVPQKEAGLTLSVPETGKTFAENALLKAQAACAASGQPAIADDSGIMVEALSGEPGVYSARYGGEGLDDWGRLCLLLKNMEGKSDRRAKFVSSIACVFPNGDVLRAEGECRGEILNEPRGDKGFGYDPIFFLPELGKTMAEISAEEKNRISHRGMALREFASVLKAYLK